MVLRNIYLSAFIALITVNIILADDADVQPQSGSSPFNPFLSSGQFRPPGLNSFGFNPPGPNPFGFDPAAPRPPGFNSPGFDYSQFVPSGFRSARDVSSLDNNNSKDPSETNPSGSNPSDSDPRVSPLSFISQFFPSGFLNSRQTRDVSSLENNNASELSETNPSGSSPSSSDSRVSPLSFISQFFPSAFGTSRQTRDVSSQENNNKEDDPHPRLLPFGSNPFGSLPFGSNPFGSLPFGFNISQFLPFGFGNSRQSRDVSSQEGDEEDDPRQRLFFSVGSRLTTCNYTETPGISCSNCFQALTCLPSNVGYVRRCTFYCNSGRCSFVPGSQCTNSTG